MNTHTTGAYCPVTSYLGGKLDSKWIPADQTDVRKTWAREIAKMRVERPFIADDYADVERDDWMVFGGFRT